MTARCGERDDKKKKKPAGVAVRARECFSPMGNPANLREVLCGHEEDEGIV